MLWLSNITQYHRVLFRVEVTVVLISEDNEVLTGDEAVDALSDGNTQANLMNVGIITDEFTPGISKTWLLRYFQMNSPNILLHIKVVK